MSIALDTHRALHARLVFSRRAEQLTRVLDTVIPASASILDIGCGNGLISRNLQHLNPGRRFTGVDVVARDTCLIPCQLYDGDTLPFEPSSFDYVLFIDVLHHTLNAEKLLEQARHIARRGIIIKDHYRESRLDFYTLALMDWFGNSQYGVALPNNYMSVRQWRELFAKLGLREVSTQANIGLYAFPFSVVFGRGLHFVSLCETSPPGVAGSR